MIRTNLPVTIYSSRVIRAVTLFIVLFHHIVVLAVEYGNLLIILVQINKYLSGWVIESLLLSWGASNSVF